MGAPRLLVTGFGPFPGAPENPTAALVRALGEMPPAMFGASELKAVVLPTEYRRSWTELEKLHGAFTADVVVHFGLNSAIDMIHVECTGRNCIDPAKLDAVGFAPLSKLLTKGGPEALASTFPVANIVTALTAAGFAAALSNDAGAYVCNATLYRSLEAAPKGRRVGFVHVPPEGAGGYDRTRLIEAATIILKTSSANETAE